MFITLKKNKKLLLCVFLSLLANALGSSSSEEVVDTKRSECQVAESRVPGSYLVKDYSSSEDDMDEDDTDEEDMNDVDIYDDDIDDDDIDDDDIDDEDIDDEDIDDEDMDDEKTEVKGVNKHTANVSPSKHIPQYKSTKRQKYKNREVAQDKQKSGTNIIESLLSAVSHFLNKQEIRTQSAKKRNYRTNRNLNI